MTKQSLKMGHPSKVTWEIIVPDSESFTSYTNCFSGTASPNDIATYATILLQRLTPYCENSDWEHFKNYGYEGLSEEVESKGLNLTDTEKKVLDVFAMSVRHNEYMKFLDRVSEWPGNCGDPQYLLDLKRKMEQDIKIIAPVYDALTGKLAPNMSPKLSSRLDKLIAEAEEVNLSQE